MLPAAPRSNRCRRRAPTRRRPPPTAAPPAATTASTCCSWCCTPACPVQLVMLLLLFASVASWVIIFRKKRVLDRAEREADDFEERFWSGADLTKLYSRRHRAQPRSSAALEAIFEAGFREFTRLRQRRGVDARMQLEGAQRAMRATASRELDGLEHNLEFLANVGSISPYVGLFGTVWGIMISFQGLANMQGSDDRHGRAGHLRGADRHRDGPVRGDPGGVGLQPLRHQGRAPDRCATTRSPRSSPRSCSARRTSTKPDRRRPMPRRPATDRHGEPPWP